jgi:hypothetical protein
MCQLIIILKKHPFGKTNFNLLLNHAFPIEFVTKV